MVASPANPSAIAVKTTSLIPLPTAPIQMSAPHAFRRAPSHLPAAGMAEMLASADRREKAKQQQQQQQGKSSSGGFRDQTNSKSFQASQSSFSGSKTPSTAKKSTAAAGKEQAAGDALDDGDFRSGAVGADGEVKKAKRTRPKVDADLLAGDKGLAAILKTFPSLKQELKGDGHEAHDVRLLISRLQMWTWQMAPAVSFPDAVNTLEKLGHTIRVQVAHEPHSPPAFVPCS